MIRIVNIRNYKAVAGERLIKVDRTSALGNPFFMKDESHRDEVCEQYKDYFYRQLVKSPDTFQQILDIATISLEEDVALACWCYPKRCHAETIKEYIEEVLYKKL